MKLQSCCTVVGADLVTCLYTVTLCRVLQRSTASDPSKTKAYLPDGKQYLVTKNGRSASLSLSLTLSLFHSLSLSLAVPCYRRCRQMSVIPENEKVIKLDQDDEGWVDTHHGISEPNYYIV